MTKAKRDECIPPPRTPEQIAADRAQLERETEAERVRWEARGGLPITLRTKREEGDFGQALKSILALAQDRDAARRALPCFEASGAGDDDRAVDLCEAVRGFDGCEWSTQHAA